MSRTRPDVLSEEDMMHGRMQMMTLSDIKDILLDPTAPVPLEPVLPLASLLVSWTLVAPEDINARTSTPMPQDVTRSSWLRSTITTHDGNVVRSLMMPVECPTNRRDYLQMPIQEIIYILLEIYYEATRSTANKWIRIPLDVRVADITHRRLFKYALEQVDPVGTTAMVIHSDNGFGFDRPEKRLDPVFAYCGSCLKLDVHQERCSGCKVRFSY